MKYFILAVGVLLIMASCSKKSSSPGSAQVAVTYQANGQSVTVTDLVIDTSYDDLQAEPSIAIEGMQLLPTMTDSTAFLLEIEGPYYSVVNMKGVFSDTAMTAGPPFAGLQFTTPSFNFSASSEPFIGAPTIAHIISNDGHTVTGTFQGDVFYSSGSLFTGDTLAVRNGKFTVTLP